MSDTTRRPFSKAVFLHAWDLQDSGAAPLMEWACATGLDTLCLAATYHSGWLVQPHHSSRRLRWSESGAAYFHPQEQLYHETRLRPPIAAMAREENWVRLGADHAQRYGLNLVTWMVGAHNTRLGLAHPSLTQQNAYGDALPHALCLAHPEVRSYLLALCRDVAVNYNPAGMQLESFQWHSVRHNHSHERDLTGLSEFERQLLSLCFNAETVRRAELAGVDAEAARRAVRDTLESAFAHAPLRLVDQPRSMAELENRHPEVGQYNRILRELADSLIQEIRCESLEGTPCKLYLQTEFNPAVAAQCDGFAVWAYGQNAAQTYRTVRSGRERLPPEWQGEFHCYVRLGMGLPGSESELRDIVLAVREAGASGVYFYNYSEAPRTMLNWLQAALRPH